MNQVGMKNTLRQPYHARGQPVPAKLGFPVPGKVIVGFLLLVALFAFEIFNFDTTQYALTDLLGDVAFAGLRWATILALAFCLIDFAGLMRFFMPEDSETGETPVEVWYLMGAWLLGATMNAIMTWWAVSLTLLNHDLGNEVLSRAQLLQVVPLFVAALVWLIRILFIGSFTVAGGYLFDLGQKRPSVPAQRLTRRDARAGTIAGRAQPVRATRRWVEETDGLTDEVPAFLRDDDQVEVQEPKKPAQPVPQWPGSEGAQRVPVPVQAENRE